MIIQPTLLVLAAGMGSRYGSLKQIEGFGPSGETIIDYSIYDAMKAGFGKVVFVIQPSMEEGFKKAMLPKLSGKIEVDFVFQELNILPEGCSLPEKREKPWGTGHAVWVSASKIKEPFAVINADDFYGHQSFLLMAEFLKNNRNRYNYAMVGFKLENTLSEHGAVSRGICEINEEGYLESVTEQTHIIRKGNEILVKGGNEEEKALSGKEIVSMNMWGFTPEVFPFFKEYFLDFLKVRNPENDKAEFYLPEVVNQLVRHDKAKVKVLPSAEKWFGVTFPDDKAVVVQNLHSLITTGVYPENLWGLTLNKSKNGQ